ncbi:thioredoxin domain-containing protein [Ahniella affigens]|nr:DUF255 domain-containing protein [Ahniella affigens]
MSTHSQPFHLRLFGLIASLLVVACSVAEAATKTAVPWQRDDHLAFKQAKAENRFVLLYLEAVWCHWCHVMDAETYADPKVQALITDHFVPLRIDQDRRPDLATRYRDYGWPATIVFAADGTEIVKRQGFMAPANFTRLLQSIVADPSPERLAGIGEEAGEPVRSDLSAELRQELLRRHRDSFDPKHGGLNASQKYLDRDQVEYALAHSDLEPERRIAETSLTGARELLDPVWGGVYQYSTGGDWDHPHFEKLTRIQAEYLRVYSLGCAMWQRAADCQVATRILDYMNAFLRGPNSAFGVSQDADLVPGQHSSSYFDGDDAARRALGVPKIDAHQYAAENGLMLEALALRAAWLCDAQAAEQAEALGAWLLKARKLKQGGFRHDAADQAGPFLADTLAAGRGMLALYQLTAERRWLDEAESAGDFILAHFAAPSGFYAAQPGQTPIPPAVQLDEVLAVGRFLNLLSHYTGETKHAAGAAHALTFLAQPKIATSRLTDAGILLLDDQRQRPPLHVVVVGSKQDAGARALFQTLSRIAEPYKRQEWWDPTGGKLRHHDVQYPKLKKPAAFVCTEKTCSVPLFTPLQVIDYLKN